jgi:NADPH-dependent ferric siderophore reductase
LFEIKGEGIAKLTNDIPSVMAYKFIDQAARQMAAGGGRSLVWIFAEQESALFARKLFDNTAGLKGITVAYIPWTKSGR